MTRLRNEPLSLDEVVREVRHAGAGAIVTFEGTVRDVNEGRAVTLLEYEAYGPMAELELAKILDEIRAEIPEARVSAVHRVGALRVGDAAVLCAASAPHRGEAFRACRAAIDRLKARLPIWKREHGPEGPYWVGWEDARCLGDDHDHHEHGEHEQADPAHSKHEHRDHAHGEHGEHEHRDHAHGQHAHRDHAHGEHGEHAHRDHAHGKPHRAH